MARENFQGDGAFVAERAEATTSLRSALGVRAISGLVSGAIVWSSCGLGLAHAVNDDPTAVAVPASHVERPRSGQPAASVLDGRVQLMTRELGLDPSQQVQLRAILQLQRQEVARVWSDPSAPAALRIAATQSIGEKTADRIRAILTDEQREKYMKSHQHDAPVGTPGGDVQTWMKTAEGRVRPSESAEPAIAKGN